MKFQLVSSKPRIFPSTSSPSTGSKFSFLVLSELAVNATCPSITATRTFPRRILFAGIDDGSMTNSRSVKQISSRHIGKGPDGGVFVARGVYSERLESAGGVEVARGVVVERTESDGGV